MVVVVFVVDPSDREVSLCYYCSVKILKNHKYIKALLICIVLVFSWCSLSDTALLYTTVPSSVIVTIVADTQ